MVRISPRGHAGLWAVLRQSVDACGAVLLQEPWSLESADAETLSVYHEEQGSCSEYRRTVEKEGRKRLL